MRWAARRGSQYFLVYVHLSICVCLCYTPWTNKNYRPEIWHNYSSWALSKNEIFFEKGTLKAVSLKTAASQGFPYISSIASSNVVSKAKWSENYPISHFLKYKSFCFLLWSVLPADWAIFLFNIFFYSVMRIFIWSCQD